MSEFESRDEMREELDRAHAFPRTIEGVRHRRSILRAAASAPHYARRATRTVAALVTEEFDSWDSVAGKQAGKAQLSQGIQENGLETLAEIGKDTPEYLCDPAVISTLLKSVVTAVSTDGRVNAAVALQGVIEHDLESVVELGSPDQLVAGLFDTDIRVSHRVARLLQQWLEQQRYNENQRAVDHVIALCTGQVENEIADAPEPVLHRKPAMALGTHRILRAVCETDDWEARRAGVYMIGAAIQVAPATIDRELATELFARVSDGDYRVRLVAVYQLSAASTLDPQLASEALTVCSTALADTHHHVRAEAAEQIGAIATNCVTVPQRTVADIERALVNGDPEVQRDAAL